MSPGPKEVYQNESEEKLKELRSRIAILEKRVGKADADIKVRYDQKMSQILGQYRQAKEKLAELPETPPDAWDDLKSGFEKEMDVLKEAVDIMFEHISLQSER